MYKNYMFKKKEGKIQKAGGGGGGENSTELQKPNTEAEVYDNNKM